jgi:hypothetical protein
VRSEALCSGHHLSLESTVRCKSLLGSLVVLISSSAWAQVPAADLAKPPADARHFVIQSTAGKHGDSWIWKTADGTRMGRESLILRAQANRESAILRAQGEAQAITNVFQAIHDGQPDQSLLAYQYLQMLPKIAEGDANKVWVIPSEITKALEGLGSAVHEVAGIPLKSEGVRHRVADYGSNDRLETGEREKSAS